MAPLRRCADATAGRGVSELTEIRKAVGISVLILFIERQPVFVGERSRNAHADALAVVRCIRSEPEILHQNVVVSGCGEILQQRLRERTDTRCRNDIPRKRDAGIQRIVDGRRLTQVGEIPGQNLCRGNGRELIDAVQIMRSRIAQAVLRARPFHDFRNHQRPAERGRIAVRHRLRLLRRRSVQRKRFRVENRVGSVPGNGSGRLVGILAAIPDLVELTAERAAQRGPTAPTTSTAASSATTTATTAAAAATPPPPPPPNPPPPPPGVKPFPPAAPAAPTPNPPLIADAPKPPRPRESLVIPPPIPGGIPILSASTPASGPPNPPPRPPPCAIIRWRVASSAPDCARPPLVLPLTRSASSPAVSSNSGGRLVAGVG